MAWGVPKLGTIVDDSTGNFDLVEPAARAAAATQQNSGDTDTTDGIASGCMFYIVRGASPPALTFTRGAGGSTYSRIISYSGGIASPLDAGSSATQGAAGNTPTTASITIGFVPLKNVAPSSSRTGARDCTNISAVPSAVR